MIVGPAEMRMKSTIGEQPSMAPRSRFELATLRLTALCLILITIMPEPRQIDGNQQVLAKWA